MCDLLAAGTRLYRDDGTPLLLLFTRHNNNAAAAEVHARVLYVNTLRLYIFDYIDYTALSLKCVHRLAGG